MTSKQDRLKQVYDHLREFFGIHTQIDFANAIRITRPALSSAMNGNEAYLTKNLFQKICAAFPGVFNIDYLLNGHGDLLTHEEDAKTETIRMEDKMRSQLVDIDGIVNKAVEIAVSAKDETINVLKSQVTDLRIQLVEKDKTIEDKNNIIAMLKQRLAEMEAEHDNFEKYPFPLGSAEPESKEHPLL
jgi:transcriptional regulator with XRE-family HTH domain